MTARPDVLFAILIVGVVSYSCRAGGYFMMRFVRITPRVELWLNAIPMAIVGAILGPVAANGGPPEWAGLVAAITIMRTTGSNVVSILGAVGLVAVLRAVI